MRFLGPIKNSHAMPTFYNISCYIILGFPGGSDGKASARNVGDPGSIPGLGRSPGEGNGNPLQHSCLEKSHDQRSLIGYSLWSRNYFKEKYYSN